MNLNTSQSVYTGVFVSDWKGLGFINPFTLPMIRIGSEGEIDKEGRHAGVTHYTSTSNWFSPPLRCLATITLPGHLT